ncbi:Rap1a/Tai family immunity protein [Pseudomonas alloputida]|uniref:Rap1a/Tai family immunity protein n=1 Tax=Pseudomonas alloputida TaxID=1940621 RepID=A0AAW7HRM5_9PSED|nr:Rap1a/Tai family immunity protein [Pseudomonas alloputida]MDM3952882.1 Rap1a/Tai family immunity protein [Pseudomonas alloputida]
MPAYVKRLLIASAALIAIPSSAYAFTGNDLSFWLKIYEKRNEPGSGWDPGAFIGYVGGVSEVVQGVLFCAPDTATHGQSAAIVAKYLKDHPEQWDKPASSIVITALSNAYPKCKK